MMRLNSNEEVVNHVAQKAGDYEELFQNCAQGTLFALQKEFNLENSLVLKAATAMPGIAQNGETCGAVIASLMILGMMYGRYEPDDKEGRDRATMAARKFCAAFKEKFGSLRCNDIHPPLFDGRVYNFMDRDDFEAFIKADGYKKCRTPPENAARIVAKIILAKLR